MIGAMYLLLSLVCITQCNYMITGDLIEKDTQEIDLVTKLIEQQNNLVKEQKEIRICLETIVQTVEKMNSVFNNLTTTIKKNENRFLALIGGLHGFLKSQGVLDPTNSSPHYSDPIINPEEKTLSNVNIITGQNMSIGKKKSSKKIPKKSDKNIKEGK